MKHTKSQKMERSCQGCVTKQRAGSILRGKSGGESEDADSATNAAKYGVPWKSDSEADQCAACWAPFTAANRRHHCRFCGDIFCGKCSSQELLHPNTNTAERSCDPCVSRLQVARAMGMELRSPQFILRACELLGCLVALALTCLAGLPFAAIVSIFSMIVAGANLYIRYQLITKGISFEEFAATLSTALSPDHLSISRLITDVLSCLLCLIAALVALATGGGVSGIFAGLILLAVGGALGASSWFSYVEASSTLMAILSGSEGEKEGRSQVSTEDPEDPDSPKLGRVNFRSNKHSDI
eukprot:TRINITY_DN18446_c0_g1_i2.p1 TRINITY_DN18446_c0_g1~~TRINITY_DN18446_c0_g1_i2.p1  ORF type:complete len:298 (+),score=59.63 TRINITY_DN18446_c0_g1_i2:250-1143(+)